jgi:serine/threonine-protein kinase
MSDSREGEVLAGKYRLESRLGSGGMGEVYRAENIQIGRTVAIKLLHPEAAAQPTIVQRFLREARAANKVKHPNVVDVLDVGEDSKGVPFIVQEFLQGQDLAQHFEDFGGRISPQSALAILLPAVEAVAAAHKSGVVHRDLKLENIFLARVGDKMVPKVLDFGISRISDDPFEARLTGTQVAMGTPLYMSPEQIRGLRFVDARSDVWSIGVMLFEMMAGEPPFNGETAGQLFLSISTDRPKSLHDKSVDSALASIIWRCLQKDVNARYQDAGEVAKDLKTFLTDRPRFESELALKGGVAALERGLGVARETTEIVSDTVSMNAQGDARNREAAAVAASPQKPLNETDFEVSPVAAAVAAAPAAPVIAVQRSPVTVADEQRAPAPNAASRAIDAEHSTGVALETENVAPVIKPRAAVRQSRPSEDSLPVATNVPPVDGEIVRPSRPSNPGAPSTKTPPKGVGLTPARPVVPVGEPIRDSREMKFRTAEADSKRRRDDSPSGIGFALVGLPALVLCLAIFSVPIVPGFRDRLLGSPSGTIDVLGCLAIAATLGMSRAGGGSNFRYVDWDLLIGALASAGVAFSFFSLAHPVVALLVGQRLPFAVFDKIFPWCLATTFLCLGIYGIRTAVDRLSRRGADVGAGLFFGVALALLAMSIRTTIDALKSQAIVTDSSQTIAPLDDDYGPDSLPTSTTRGRDAGVRVHRSAPVAPPSSIESTGQGRPRRR